ncbi:MAG: leucine-rich repeat domain-containing protein [Bacteroidaceae bacterium]|nr:leucine-rich repeat domain-containing protein [Bacteroidaceae bacterium]
MSKSDEINTFYLCSEGYSVIKNLEIPKTVTSIKEYRFLGLVGLKSVTIPDNVTSIERGSFGYCPDLETVSFGDKITTIDGFSDCPKLSRIQWGKKVETVNYYAFHGHNISSLVLPEGIKSIGAAAFSSNQLTSVVIPNSVVEIQDAAFYSDNLASVTSFIKNPESTSWEPNYCPFSDNTLYNATLYVPKGTKSKYKAAKGWKDFVWIEEFDATDIESIQDIHHESSLFSINGTRIPKMKRGINIIKMSDGTTKKVLVK